MADTKRSQRRSNSSRNSRTKSNNNSPKQDNSRRRGKKPKTPPSDTPGKSQPRSGDAVLIQSKLSRPVLDLINKTFNGENGLMKSLIEEPAVRLLEEISEDEGLRAVHEFVERYRVAKHKILRSKAGYLRGVCQKYWKANRLEQKKALLKKASSTTSSDKSHPRNMSSLVSETIESLFTPASGLAVSIIDDSVQRRLSQLPDEQAIEALHEFCAAVMYRQDRIRNMNAYLMNIIKRRVTGQHSRPTPQASPYEGVTKESPRDAGEKLAAYDARSSQRRAEFTFADRRPSQQQRPHSLGFLPRDAVRRPEHSPPPQQNRSQSNDAEYGEMHRPPMVKPRTSRSAPDLQEHPSHRFGAVSNPTPPGTRRPPIPLMGQKSNPVQFDVSIPDPFPTEEPTPLFRRHVHSEPYVSQRNEQQLHLRKGFLSERPKNPKSYRSKQLFAPKSDSDSGGEESEFVYLNHDEVEEESVASMGSLSDDGPQGPSCSESRSASPFKPPLQVRDSHSIRRQQPALIEARHSRKITAEENQSRLKAMNVELRLENEGLKQEVQRLQNALRHARRELDTLRQQQYHSHDSRSRSPSCEQHFVQFDGRMMAPQHGGISLPSPQLAGMTMNPGTPTGMGHPGILDPYGIAMPMAPPQFIPQFGPPPFPLGPPSTGLPLSQPNSVSSLGGYPYAFRQM